MAVVAREMRCGACSVFLIEPGERRPALSAGFREAMALADAFAPEVAVELAAQAVSRMASGSREEPGRSLLGVPMVLRGRAVGAIVVESEGGDAFSAEATSALESAAAQLVGMVVNARLIEAFDRHEAPALVLVPPAAEQRDADRGEVILRGTPAGPGVGIGAVAFRGVHELGPDARIVPSRGEEAEKERLRDALVKTRNDIARLQDAAAHDIDEEHALIFSSHLLLMNDPAVLDRMDRALSAGLSAPVAIDDALKELEDLLGAVPDAYIQERVEDIDDLRGRLLSHALDAGGRAKHGGRILVTRRIPPSLVVELKADRAQGIVTEAGGATSHGALLSRALGIPAVTGVADLLERVGVDDEMIVDGEAGEVILRPTAETLATYRERARRAERRRTQHARYRERPLETADGVRVGMLANVAVASNLATALDNGAEGVGLYRTEFPFIVREQFATREEQVRIYRKAYDAFPGGPVNFRILDLGGDKFLPGSSLGAARSPFHGYRAIRVLFDYPHILRDQNPGVRARSGRQAAQHPDPDGHLDGGAPSREGVHRRGPRRAPGRRRAAPAGPGRDDRSAGGGRDRGRPREGGGLCLPRHQRSHAVRDGRRPRGSADVVAEGRISPRDPPHGAAHGDRGARGGQAGERLRRDGVAGRSGRGARGARGGRAQRGAAGDPGAEAGVCGPRESAG